MNKMVLLFKSIQRILKKFFKGDRYIYLIIVFLLVSSVPIMFSSTGPLAHSTTNGVIWIPLMKQLIFVAFGVFCMGFISCMNINFVRKLIPIAIFFATVALGIAFMFKTGSTARTINVFGIRFQITEISKLVIVVYSAHLLGRYSKTKELRKSGLWRVVIWNSFAMGLILLSDFSTFALIGITLLVLFFLANSPIKEILKLGFLLIVFFGGIFLAMKAKVIPSVGRFATVDSRIASFFQPEDDKIITDFSNYKMKQIDYSKVAIQRGGVTGRKDKSLISNYLRSSYNDFVYAMINEVFGIIFAIFILLLYVFFFTRVYLITAKISEERLYQVLMVAGIGSLYFFQAIANMAVAIELIPVTGQPLPFISQGGTSVVITCVGIGIIQCIAQASRIEQLKQRNEEKDQEEILEAERRDKVFNELSDEHEFDLY